MAEVKFTKTHEWIKIEQDLATIGITDYAQKELGDIVFVELPDSGDNISKGKTFATVESTKAAAEIYAPLSGEVSEINDVLSDSPQLLNESPRDGGWMIKVTIGDSSELEGLMDEAGYNSFIAGEGK